MTPEEQKKQVQIEFEKKRILIDSKIAELSTYFEDGCLVSVIVRRPGNDAQTIIIGPDSIEELERIIVLMRENKQKKVDIYIPKVVLN